MSSEARYRLPESDSNPFQAPRFTCFDRESAFWRMASNLAACLSASPKRAPHWAFAPMLRSAYLPKRFSFSPLLASVFLHVAGIAWLIAFPSFAPDALQSVTVAEEPRTERRIIWYTKSDFLPSVNTAGKPRTANRTPRSSVAPIPLQEAQSRSVQVIISRAEVKNSRQVVVQPEAPHIQIESDVRLPNIVSVSPALVPPPPSTIEVQRPLPQLNVPRLPAPVVAAPVVPPPKPELPQVAVAAVKVNDLPKLPVPVPSPPPARRLPAVPPPPDVTAAAEATSLPNLVALSAVPAPPPEKGVIIVRLGNRAGAFVVSPDGEQARARSGSAPDSDGGGDSLGLLAADIHIPPLGVAGGRAPELAGPVVANVPGPPPAVAEPRSSAPPSPRPAPDMNKLLASAMRPARVSELARPQTIDPGGFGQSRVYTTYINMPNLTSGTGSWVLRFAELTGDGNGSPEEELSSPIALRKVDPQYVPSAIRDRVEGTVVLAAHILRDGSVTNVSVERSLDPRLDTSATEALLRWQFEPARKRGLPVDVDVRVQIPFRLPAF